MRKSRHQIGFLEAPNDKSSFGSLRNSDRMLHDGRLAPLQACACRRQADRWLRTSRMLPNCVTTAAVLAFITG
jgi:hypothetical protein